MTTCVKEWLWCKMKKAAHWSRGEERRGGGGGVNPVTLSGEHSGVVRGLYKTLTINDSKHLNDRETRRGGSSVVCGSGWQFSGRHRHPERWVNIFTTLIFWGLYFTAISYVLCSLLMCSTTGCLSNRNNDWEKKGFEKQTMNVWEWRCRQRGEGERGGKS